MSDEMTNKTASKWRRFLCKVGWHNWRHADSFTTTGRTTVRERVIYELQPRTFHFRECAACGKFSQYYPSNPSPNP